ncbi:hypothetical protein [Nocardia cyriacigeorgica]|uniref:hypothetical protein n=1 Tax=Nocardia cyriacigeorgica TaxID=135487 RepID=UPI0024548EB4|nr:hypothetical protein [Nocardia cyriacigeorgica]
MALHFRLLINGLTIGNFYAVRVEGEAEADSINTYDVEIEGGMSDRWRENVQHRYGDGAWELVRKALEQKGAG